MKPDSAPLSLFDLGDPDEYSSAAIAPLPSYISTHRARLRQRFREAGAQALPDYELLEMLLFRALPRRDVKPLAWRLLKAFGSFSGVLAARPAALLKVEGTGEAVVTEIKLAEAIAQRFARAQISQKPILSNWDALLRYCHTQMSHLETEEFRVLFLDRKNVLIADEAQGRGTVDHVPVYPREIVKRALELNASALILVHNHPSGDPYPSAADIQLTQQILQALTVMGLTLHDHLVIGKGREISFNAEGLL